MTRYVEGWEGLLGVGIQTVSLSTAVNSSKYITIKPPLDLKLREPGRSVIEDGIQKTPGSKITSRGRRSITGNIPFYFMPGEGGDLFLAHVFGNRNTVAGSAGVGYTHTMTMVLTAGDNPDYGMTIERFIGGDGTTLMADFVGMFINKLDIDIPEEGPVVLTADMLGRSVTTGGTVPTPTYGNTHVFEAWMKDLKIGATLGAVASVNVKSCKVSIDKKAKLVTDNLGSSQYPIGVTWGKPVVTIEFTQTLQDSLTLYNYWLGETQNAITVTLTHDQLAGSASGVYSLTLRFPKVEWLGEPPDLSGPQDIDVTYRVQAMLETTTYNYYAQAVLVNAITGAYTV